MDAESVKEKYCSTREAAKMLGVSLTTAQVMVEDGHLKAWKTAGGHRRISIDSVKSMLQNREAGGSISSNSSDDYTVLIAEDDEALCKLYVRTFSSWKLPIKLITVNNGMEAMVLLERMRPSLLILDLGMPRMNGFEMIRLIRSKTEFNHIDIVVITGLERRDVDKKGGVPPAVTIFPKPVPWQQVKGFVQAALSRRELAGQ
jgi:excisionase family DNA binding protein